MSNTQMNMLDDDTTAVANKQLHVEKIYVTRGKNLIDDQGRKADKFYGLLIGGKIHWMNHTFATLTELSRELRSINISLTGVGEWGIIKDNCAYFDNKVVTVQKSHNEMFEGNSMYLNKAEFFKEGHLWWYLDDIKAKYFPDLEVA